MANNRAIYNEAMRRGAAYVSQENWQQAFKAYRLAINEFPHHPEAYAGLGEACIGLKQLPKALDCFKLAAKYSRGGIHYLRKVADIQERMGQLTDAGRTYLAIGELLLRKQQFDDAIANWERAIRLEPNLTGAHKRLAMVYQRQHKTRDAVREYLAIARILEMQGDKKRALQMCKAALRLDPENQDVSMAIRLIQYGENAYPEEEAEPEPEAPPVVEEEDTIASAVRQMAAVFEEEQRQAQAKHGSQEPPASAVEKAFKLAENELNGEILREDDDENGNATLSKLERDALIGQALDFEFRGQAEEAIHCYRQAIEGGLNMPAAYFRLGLLYANNGREKEARQFFQQAALDDRYLTAIQEVMQNNF
ncbi:MAG: hypothetical protein Kow0080_11500 [Candidatus Promineifilaceae bacterium]